MDNEGDRASGLLILSHTKISMVYNPDLVGNHDWAGDKDWLGDREPVNQDKDTTMFSSFVTCVRYAKGC